MRLILGDQPFLGVSGAACPPTRDAFDAALAADVLYAEADEVLGPAHLDVEELAATADAWFGATAMGACPWRSHESCSLSLDPSNGRFAVSVTAMPARRYTFPAGAAGYGKPEHLAG